MPTQNIFPALRYGDCDRALSWLKEAFGFEEKAVHRAQNEAIHHAELRLDDGLIMFGHDDGMGAVPDRRHSIYVCVPDPDEHYERAKAAGAEISASSPTSRTVHANTAPATSRATRGGSRHLQPA